MSGEEWFDKKSRWMEDILGKEHDVVMSSSRPYSSGGSLDLHYYPNGIPGTAIATKQLARETGPSPSNDKYKKYEWVMFTREKLNMEHANDQFTSFGQIHQFIASTLNRVARYNESTTLQPNQTCAIPMDDDDDLLYLLLTTYGAKSDEQEDFGLMIVMEIFPTEIAFATEHGKEALLKLLQEKEVYPYADLDRDPVV